MAEPGEGRGSDGNEDREGLAARLEMAEHRYRALIESMPAIIYVEEPSHAGPTELIGPGIADILGVSPQEYLDQEDFWQTHLHPEDRERIVADYLAWQDAAEPGDSGHQRYRMVSEDGRVTWLDDRFTLLEDPNGRRYVQGVMIDVTEQVEALAEMSARERILAALARSTQALLRAAEWKDAIDLLLSDLGEATGVTHVSVWQNEALPDGASVERFVAGWSAPGIGLADPLGAVTPLDGWEAWVGSMRRGEPVVGMIRDRDQTERDWYADRGMVSILDVPVFVDGTWWGVIGFDSAEERGWLASEIDALELAAETIGAAIGRQQTAERLRETEVRYQALVEQIPAVLYIDLPGAELRTAYISPQINEILGLSPDEWLSDPGLWFRHLHPDDRDFALLTYRRGVAKRRPFSYEYRMLTPRGLVWIRDDAVVITEQDGTVKVQGVMFDITEEKLAEEALLASESREREAAERLRNLDQMKNAFLAAVSHELRSPLTTVLGLAVTLEKMDLPEDERQDLLARLAANARKLERLLSDLLDIDRLSRGIVTAERHTIDVGELVARTARATAEHLGARKLVIGEGSVLASLDAPKVERIVENLLVNAARHTPEGTTIWARAEPFREGVLIVVEDDGPGISDDLKDSVFDPFRQGPTTAPRPGTGIGLTLVRSFTELHSGSAWVQDREGGGASFRAYLPDSEEQAPV